MKFRTSFAVLLLAATFVRAGGVERRTFSITVDKTFSGSHQMVVETRDDGSEVLTAQADVTVKALIFTYKYTYHGVELWKDGQLLRITTSANDNGKKHAVTAEANKDGLAMKADGQDSVVKGSVWPTSYWRLPPLKKRGPNLMLLDADTGKLINAKLEKVGVEKLTVLGKQVDANHFRLTGGVQVDVWYDGDDRLLRQESIEEGRRVVMELSRLLRN